MLSSSVATTPMEPIKQKPNEYPVPPSPSPSFLQKIYRNIKSHQLLVFVYLGIVFFGCLHSIFGSPHHSYWSSKRNILNIFFAKNGWFWTTIVYLAYANIIHPRISNGPHLARSLARWALATVYWYFLTQWFLGPSILDRFFTLTGGQCVSLTSDLTSVATGLECKRGGGTWVGGHDVSGHCLLLIHSSLFLLEETRGGIKGLEQQNTIGKVLGWAVLGLLVMWAWMLLFTAMYFHEAMDLASGTLAGVTFWLIMVS
ncbi:inositol phospholipid synthesis and fat-storage-inducing TM-domain-containing protein [Jimgerdemannia flammicorona]|uniref:Inositol phospholipid synthesis and fat-storage-inducing TM-domain-containing protein n=2 Tax=Jimgerdemannia flammicorona TaxID=994334 RepID=A0A433D6K3_9FUNG|nr:inositol phospholipid synthesis and fat-storage-inducing TM-domain-containing protein [Jimgerdemannia flammicorona]RUS29242.1 inositol phospholipid synthesis and fat-storage-inducing TM-domain-containing protein [Jimgerdemannia flammicorona]